MPISPTSGAPKKRYPLEPGTVIGQSPAPLPAPPTHRQTPPDDHLSQATRQGLRDRKRLHVARNAVASAAGMVEHAEFVLGDLSYDLPSGHHLVLSLEKARAALHVALSALLDGGGL